MASAAVKKLNWGKPALWPMWVALPTVVILGVGLMCAAIWSMWLAVGRPPLTHTWDTQAQLDIVRTSLILTGGVGGFAALVVFYRRQRIAEYGQRRENVRLCNERFTIASEQLGHESAAVRLAGIYAIAALADEWIPQRQTCIDVLCGYLRMPYQSAEDQSGWREGEREVRLSVIRAIRDHLRRDRAKDALTWQGLDFDFTHATFDGGDFSGTSFAGGMVSFEGVRFSGSVSFMGAWFSAGKVSFVGAQFAGGNVYFADAHFCGASVYFMDALFASGILVFMGAQFRGSDVYFLGARFCGADVSFRGAVFSAGHISFRGAQFCGGHVSLGGAGFSGGHVDFSAVSDWSAPVLFDTWLGGVPSGLVLPREVTLELTGPQ